MRNRSTGFWSNGQGEYLKALRQEEDDALSPLRQALKSATDPVLRQALKQQIKAIQDEFKRKRKAAGSSLFSKT